MCDVLDGFRVWGDLSVNNESLTVGKDSTHSWLSGELVNSLLWLYTLQARSSCRAVVTLYTAYCPLVALMSSRCYSNKLYILQAALTTTHCSHRYNHTSQRRSVWITHCRVSGNVLFSIVRFQLKHCSNFASQDIKIFTLNFINNIIIFTNQ